MLVHTDRATNNKSGTIKLAFLGIALQTVGSLRTSHSFTFARLGPGLLVLTGKSMATWREGFLLAEFGVDA